MATKNFDAVIILCPNVGYDQGVFDEYGPDSLYIGGQTRMQAAVDLYNDPSVTIGSFVVVGGGIDAEPAERWAKTDNMRRFLLDNGVPQPMITRVVSGADTLGNMRAVWVTLRMVLQGKTIGVLTNAYHMPRAMLFATQDQFDWGGAQFVPLPAESIIMSAVDLPAAGDTRLVARQKREHQGLLDWQHGVYIRQYLPVNEWQGEADTRA